MEKQKARLNPNYMNKGVDKYIKWWEFWPNIESLTLKPKVLGFDVSRSLALTLQDVVVHEA